MGSFIDAPVGGLQILKSRAFSEYRSIRTLDTSRAFGKIVDAAIERAYSETGEPGDLPQDQEGKIATLTGILQNSALDHYGVDITEPTDEAIYLLREAVKKRGFDRVPTQPTKERKLIGDDWPHLLSVAAKRAFGRRGAARAALLVMAYHFRSTDLRVSQGSGDE